MKSSSIWKCLPHPSPFLSTVLFLGISSVLFAGCSSGDEAIDGLSRSIQETPQGDDTPISAVGFKIGDPDTDYSSFWPYGFDQTADVLQATVLALGDIKIDTAGVFHVSPSPFVQPSGRRNERQWTYQLALESYGREDRMTHIGAPVIATHRPAEAELKYEEGVRLVYQHRHEGIKLFIHLDERPTADGNLKFRFHQRGEGLRFHTDDDLAIATHGSGEAFRWQGLIAFDVNKRALPVSISTDDDLLVFEVNDRDAVYPITVDPLATSSSWAVSGSQDNSSFGNHLATGDVNGDGYTDVLVSDPLFSGNEVNQGRVLLFLGSEDGLSYSASLSIAGDSPSEQLGVATDIGADFFGDGCDEIVVGSPGFGDFRGRVLHFRPFDCTQSEPTLQPELVWEVEGRIDTFELLGRSISTGDFNCDGNPDLLVSAPNRSVEDEFGDEQTLAGMVEFYTSDPNSFPPLDENAAFSYSPAEQNGRFGWVNTTIPELDGREFVTTARCNAFAAGSRSRNGNRGSVFIFGHDENGQILTPPIQFDGDNDGEGLGTSLAAVPSPHHTIVNGQPISALAVGAATFGAGTTTLPGYVRYIEYSEDTETLEVVWQIDGPHIGSLFGTSIAGSLDFNDDGYSDLVVGAPDYDANTDNGAEGGVFVYLGTPDGLSDEPQLILDSGQSGSEFGQAVTGLRDFNGDSDALLVGARRYDGLVENGGRLFLYPGQETCYIGGVFYSDGDENPDNMCQVCNVDVDREDWSANTEGLTCDSGDACAISVCQAGQCVDQGQIDCDDGNPCTVDSCSAGECVYETAPADGEVCGDDGLSCTTQICSEGVCEAAVVEGCMIDGACYADGAVNVGSECFHCDSSISADSWSPRPQGAACDNGLFCTLNDQCDGTGQCEAGDPRVCDAVECYADVTCSNAANACVPVNPETGTSCDDGNACTTNECQAGSCSVVDTVSCDQFDTQCTVGVCDSATGDCSGVPVADGTVCSDGNVCTQNSCQSGVCVADQNVSCDDGNPCTVGSCDADAGGCVFDAEAANGASCAIGDGLSCTAGVCSDGGCEAVLVSGCLIEGACVGNGDIHPINSCMHCDPSQATDAWSPRPNGLVCGGATCSSDNMAIGESVCGEGECLAPDADECGDYLCDDGACLTECVDDDDCFDDAYCNDDLECSTENRPPVANAGADQFVNDDDEVTLDGTGSSDPDGDDLEYFWVQVSGETVTLSDDTAAAPSFIAPRAPVGEELELVFELVVDDGEFESDPVQTRVFVTNEGNQAPQAVIEGPDTAVPAETILLDGIESFDADGDTIVSYQWSLVMGEGPAPTIAQTDRDSAINVTFPDADEITQDSLYTFGLIVSDGQANSPQAEHDVLVIAPDLPVEPEPGDDVGDEVGVPDTGTPDVGTPDVGGEDPDEEIGTLQGSGCFCSASGGGNDTQGMLTFLAAVGLLVWRKRRS